jgi:hypothetical protein
MNSIINVLRGWFIINYILNIQFFFNKTVIRLHWKGSRLKLCRELMPVYLYCIMRAISNIRTQNWKMQILIVNVNDICSFLLGFKNLEHLVTYIIFSSFKLIIL